MQKLISHLIERVTPKKKPKPVPKPSARTHSFTKQASETQRHLRLLEHPANTLYVILPYFNYCSYARRKQLFLEFVARYSAMPGVALIVVEAARQGKAFELPNPIPGVRAHFRVITHDPLWLKENLINIGVSRLPREWRYMAWIDADITFLNERWAEDTRNILAANPNMVLQMFQTSANMGPEGEILKIDKSFAFQYLNGTQAPSVAANSKYTDWHPGYAWACSHTAYVAMGGLIDWAILGSADRHMALAIIGSALGSCPGQMTDDYRSRLSEFQARCKSANLKIGVLKGSILHHWHGRMCDRKYRERWNILVTHAYDPTQDLVRSHRCGLLQFTEKGRRMVPDLDAYFLGRQEDNMMV